MQRGFSLVELSIVLVILGLLTGGILAGQSLIRAAELRSITAEYQRYTAAVMSFRDRYMALPGDMRNATSFWGKDAAACNAESGITASPGTCNGSGDGMISHNSTYYYEQFRAWQHLANAGLIEGSYSGVAGSGSSEHTVGGTNAPTSRISTGVWGMKWLGVQDGTASPFAGDYGNVLLFGGQHTTSPPTTAILNATEAWGIDTKMDDGKPGTGKLRAYKATFRADCATTDTPNSSAYDLIKSTLACALIFTIM